MRAVSFNDSAAYAALFAPAAVRMPLGAGPKYGPGWIRASEQATYDVAHWSVGSAQLEMLQVAECGVGEIARAEVRATSCADGATAVF